MALLSIPLGARGEIFFVEHSRVHVKDGVVVRETDADGRFASYNIPHLNTAMLMLGNGTSISRDAACLLAKANIVVCFTGEGGSPLHSATPVDFLPLSPVCEYRPTEYMQTWARRFFDEDQRLAAAKMMLRRRVAITHALWSATELYDLHGRCPKTELLPDIEPLSEMEGLLAAEGRHAKIVYAAAARLFQVNEFSRKPGEGVDVANDRLDHFNYILYGIAASVLHGLGISFAFPAMHGKTRNGGLVFDIADLVKDGLSVPLAFYCAAEGLSESTSRALLIEEIQRHKIIPLLFSETKEILCGKP
jgi:CRISPR-associated protein Cas1